MSIWGLNSQGMPLLISQIKAVTVTLLITGTKHQAEANEGGKVYFYAVSQSTVLAVRVSVLLPADGPENRASIQAGTRGG